VTTATVRVTEKGSVVSIAGILGVVTVIPGMPTALAGKTFQLGIGRKTMASNRRSHIKLRYALLAAATAYLLATSKALKTEVKKKHTHTHTLALLQIMN